MNSLAAIIRAETAGRGVLPFARFMELALYHPGLGYYETQKNSPGRHGDFYTNVSVGGLFGQLLACQFASWLDGLKSSPASPVTRRPSFALIEAGAHDGKLAADILNWLQSRRADLFSQIEYWILEPSARRQEWQREALKHFAPRVRWFADFENLSLVTRHSSLSGVIFSNELLDAFPVHRFGWDAAEKKWFEWGVALNGKKFVWARCPNSPALQSGEVPSPAGAGEGGRRPDEGRGVEHKFVAGVRGLPSSIFHLPSSLLDVLPDGYTIETSPAAENWWRQAAGVLQHGKLLAIDYGFTGDEMFSPARSRGTLRAYFQHHVTDDLLANPGEQDLTAHVNFQAIQQAGENAGLTTEFFGTQTKFLTEIFAAEWKMGDGSWELGKSQSANSQLPTPKLSRQFQTLTHPEHLGRAFRVLVQSR